MRKIMAVLVLAMALAGLMPFASAEMQQAGPVQVDASLTGSSGGSGSGNASESGAPVPTLYADQTRERQRNYTLDAEQIRERIRERIESGEGIMVQRRQIARQMLEAAKQRYAAARERYSNAKEAYAQARSRLNQTREAYKSCARSETEECENIRKETKANSKQFLLKTVERIESMIEKLKEKIESTEYINNEVAEERTEALEARIAELEEAKAAVEGLTDESTPAEIRDVLSQIKNSWRNTKSDMEQSVGRLMNAKIGGVVVKAEQLSKRLEIAKNKLAEQGQDTAELEGLIEEFNANVDSAKESYAFAREEHTNAANAASGSEASQAMQNANRHMQQARNELQEAHAVLAKITRQIRSMNGQDELEEAEAEQEAEA